MGPPGHPTTGMRRQASKGGFRTQKEAQRYLANVVVRVADGIYVEPSKQALAAFMRDEWLPAITATVRPSTVATYRQGCARVARSDIGAVPLRSLTGGHLNALYAEMERAGLSVATRRLTHSTIHRALRDAVRWDKLTRNPAASADPPGCPGLGWRRGRRPSSGASSTTSEGIAYSRSGGSLQPLGCAAANCWGSRS